MKTVFVQLLGIMTLNVVVLGDTYHDFCTNSVAAFLTGLSAEPCFTNQIADYAAETNGAARLSAYSVMAVAMFDIFEQENSEAALAHCAMNCSNILNAIDCPSNVWQKSAASLILATVLATDSHYQEALAVCTNALSLLPTEPTTTDDSTLWSAIANHHLAGDMSLGDSLKLYSALSLIFSNEYSLLPLYTNSLPSSASDIIDEALGNR